MKYLLSVLLAIFACSCATVVRGTSETAKFESAPAGADVTAESISDDKQGPFYCMTPCSLELKRKRTWRVDFALEGYKPVSGLLKPVVTGGGVAAGAGNALLGGIIGIGIDAGTGANLDLRPNPMIAELEPLDSPKKSRILDAELIVDEAEEELPVDESIMTDEELSDESIDESSELNEEVTPEDVLSPDETDFEEDGDEIDPGAAPIGISFDDGIVAEPSSKIDGAVTVASEREEVRLYKPGERAPNDEEADDLNRLQFQDLGGIKE